jgi:hypothetical protein
MPRLIDLQYTIAGALAAGAMLTVPAIAKPMPGVPPSSHAATASPRQDLRGERALDAARPVAKTAPTSSTAGDDEDVNVWRILGFGLAGMGAAAGSAAGLARHHRVRARRVVA